MTTERDDLAEGWYEFITDDGMTSVAYVLESGNLYLPVETLMDEDFMGAARIYRLVRAPRTITTVEELDALPEGSIILDSDPDALLKVEGGQWRSLIDPDEPFKSLYLSLPATVLHEGDA